MDGIFSVAQKVEGTVVERCIFLVRESFEAEGNVSVPKERGRLLHDAAQSIEVECVELARARIGGRP
ncbi:hypothetical protein D3C76_1276150 [compost metagenome]